MDAPAIAAGGRPGEEAQLVRNVHHITEYRARIPLLLGVSRARRLIASAAALGVLLAASAATAVIIASGDGTGNTTAPSDDPGWTNVGSRLSLTVVYLRNRWVLTAGHVGAGEVILDGVTYPIVPGSKTFMVNPDETVPDLIVFRLQDDPGLPSMTIASTTPPANNVSVTMIGRGRDRGNAMTWSGYDGWEWGASSRMRWGTNRIEYNSVLAIDTQSFVTEFTELGTPDSTSHEAHAALGDSGGGVFRKTGGSWELVGIMFAVDVHPNQPASTALYENLMAAVDLATYREQIVAIIDAPNCSNSIDDDGDGLSDYPADPGCDDATDSSEQSPSLPCDDGIDNDLDGLTDFPADPECTSPTAPSESPIEPLPAGGVPTSLITTGALLALGALEARRGRAKR